jgi:hypothetical protein
VNKWIKPLSLLMGEIYYILMTYGRVTPLPLNILDPFQGKGQKIKICG